MRSLLRKIRDRLFAGLARKSDLDSLYAQISGLLQIQSAMDGKPTLRQLRGWAISPDAMAWILADLQTREAPAVIEFGSGQSTVILAGALKHRGGRLVSVEHDLDHCLAIRNELALFDLADRVEFVHAPLHQDDGHPAIFSYDRSALPEIAIDVALVDGPPYTNGPLTRLPPLRWSASHLRPNGAIFLDDADRESEQSCLTLFMTERPNLRLTRRVAEKGLAELRRD